MTESSQPPEHSVAIGLGSRDVVDPENLLRYNSSGQKVVRYRRKLLTIPEVRSTGPTSPRISFTPAKLLEKLATPTDWFSITKPSASERYVGILLLSRETSRTIT